MDENKTWNKVTSVYPLDTEKMNSPKRRRKAKFGGIAKKLAMSKVQNLAEITPNIPFTEFNFYDLYRKTFENTELGRIKKLFPGHEMVESLGLTNYKLLMTLRWKKRRT